MWELKGDKIVAHDIPVNIPADAKIVTKRDNAVAVPFTKLNAFDVRYPIFDSAIVPPTWDKAKYRNSIRNVWQYAAQALSEAENIIVAGFSLPSTDDFFKYLYAAWVRRAVPVKEILGM